MAVFVQDSFTGPDGTLLENRSGEVGARWSRHPSRPGDGLTLQGNRLQAVFAATEYYASGLPSGREYAIECDVVIGRSEIGVFGRAEISEATWYEAAVGSGGLVYFRKKVGGALSTLGIYDTGLGTGQSVHICLELTDAAKRVFVNGVLRLTSGDNSIVSAGRVGVHGAGDTAALDNLSAYDLGTDVSSFFDTRSSVQTQIQSLFDSRTTVGLERRTSFDTRSTVHSQFLRPFDTRSTVYSQFLRLFDTRVQVLARAIGFFHSSGQIAFSRAPLRPDRTLELIQAEELSAGGVRFGFDPYAQEALLPLRWQGLPEAEAAALETFVRDVVGGMSEPFTYTDVAGRSLTVRLASPVLDITERAHGRRDVTLILMEA